MLRGLYIAGGGMTERSAKFDTLANNIANLQTDTFKRDRTAFTQFHDLLLSKVQSGEKTPQVGNISLGSMVSSEPFTDYTQGPLVQTGDDHDVAIEGPGFIRVKMPDDSIRYTRDAHWNVTKEGILVNRGGYPILDDGGQEITITGNGKLLIGESGEITQNKTQVAKIGLVELSDLRMLQKDGDLNYTLGGDPTLLETQATGSTLMQNYAEKANFSPLSVVTEMIVLLREYESSQKVVQVFDETMDMASSKLGALSG
jgi:flagellar basal-body rod protein FlgF